ncbi:hypothetical protein [Aquipuribacter sp. MA13-6]|uniref:hypothetical protein n=1 Tax=unclassified Aquipuribacter TaxID=2635084 RepID=UPI003EEA1334
MTPPGVVAPTRQDRFARWASPLLGGPAGRRVAVPGHPWWSPARVLVVVALATTLLAVLRSQHCRAQGWTTPGQFVHTCYSDVAVLFGTLGGTPGSLLGLDAAAPDGLAQPALTAYVAALLAVLVGPLQGVSELLVSGGGDVVVDAGPRVYFDLFAVVAAGSLVVAVLAVVSLSGRRPWDATLLALSPVVVLSGLVSFDLLGVALGVLAVAVWARGRPLLAGVVLGLAVSARFHVVLVVLALVLLAVRGGRAREVAVAGSAAAFTWAAVNLPLALLSPQAWTAPARTWWAAEPGYGSWLLVPRLLADEQVSGVRALTGPESSVASLVLTLLVLVGVSVWALSTPRAPRLPVLVLLLLVATFVVSKTVPVQASLWLLPWAALALPRWREHLWWWAAEALYVVAVWQYLVGLSEANRALPAGFYAVLMVGRLAAMAWLGWQAFQLGRHPETDEVRLDGDGQDPAAGPLWGAEDRVVVRFG